MDDTDLRRQMTVGELRDFLQRFDADVPIYVEHSTHVQSTDCSVLVRVLSKTICALQDDERRPYLVIDVIDEAELNRAGATLG